MATVTKTFTFDSSLSGWVASAGTPDTTLVWSSTGGNTGGCISSRIFGRKNAASVWWYYRGTWESLGVPSGATVTNIQLLGFDWSCSVWNVGDPATQILESHLYGGEGIAGIINTLSTSIPTVSSTTAYATISGTQQTIDVDYQASDTFIETHFRLILESANDKDAEVVILMDNYSIEITYTDSSPTIIYNQVYNIITNM